MNETTLDFDNLSDRGIKAALREYRAEVADILAAPMRDVPPVDYLDGCVVVNYPDAFIWDPTEDEILGLQMATGATRAETIGKKPGYRVRVRLYEPRTFLTRAHELSRV